MGRRRRKLWRWSTGPRGARVTVFERVPGGPLYLSVPRTAGGERKISLRHRDQDRAQAQATAYSARRQRGVEGLGRLSVAHLFDLYASASQRRARPWSPMHRAEVERAVEAWTRYLGPTFDVRRFGPREWEDYLAKRATGELNGRGRHVPDPAARHVTRPRTLAKEAKVLRAACRRATIERTAGGGFLLEGDPTRGLALPADPDPRRPRADEDRVAALLQAAPEIPMRVGLGKRARREPSYLPALVRLAADTGRRISAILALRWSDWAPDRGRCGALHWRAESDKVRRDRWTPITPAIRRAIEEHRRHRPGVGEAWLFPAPNNPERPVNRHVADRWLRRAEQLAELPHLAAGLWHPFRRRWATLRKHLPLTDVAEAGGWVETSTLLRCYQQPDDATIEAVVNLRARRRRGSR